VFPHLVGLSFSKRRVRWESKKILESSVGGPTFGGVVEELFKMCEEDELRLFVGIAKHIWFRRNELIHGGPFTYLDVLVQQARQSLIDFSAANIKEEESHI
jgi:hypothetical protein